MNWNTIQVVIASMVLLTVVYDGYRLFWKNEAFGKMNSLWYMVVAAVYLVDQIIKYS